MVEAKMKAKILIVDDERDFTMATGTILEANGYEVAVANSSREAEESIKKSKPDLVLLDVMMERMDDGFTFCRKLKSDPETSSTPVIMLTGVTGKTGLKFSARTDGEWLPADDYLDKPVNPRDLIQRVKKFVG